MSYTLYCDVAFGASKTGLGTVGYRLYDSAGSPAGSRTTSGVTEEGGGQYGASVVFPDNFRGSLRWDTGEGTPRVASCAVNPEDAGAVLAGAISDASFTMTADPSGVPTGPVGYIQWLAAREGLTRDVVRDATHIRVKRADGTTDWTASGYTAGVSAETVEAAG